MIDINKARGYKLLIKRILVPFDNSKYSEKCLVYAVNLANLVFQGNKGKPTVNILITCNSRITHH